MLNKNNSVFASCSTLTFTCDLTGQSAKKCHAELRQCDLFSIVSFNKNPGEYWTLSIGYLQL